MNFTRKDKAGFIWYGAIGLVLFACLAYIDRWTEGMLKDGLFAIFGWMFLVLGIRIEPNE